MSHAAHASGPVDVFVARQPILNAHGQTFAYELLFRSGLAHAIDENRALFDDGNIATSRVITSSLMSIGFERVLGGKLGFINFTRDHLLQGSAYLLPKESVVIELLESIEADAEVVANCRELKRRGYKLALDDFTGHPGIEPLAALSNFIKVDFRLTIPGEQERLVRRYASRDVQLVAEKVESWEEFARARQAGYGLFQGYYFSIPEVVGGRGVAGFTLNYVRLFQELYRSELRFDRIEAILTSELPLSHKLLHYLNSPLFRLNTPVSSIRHALALLDEEETRRWTLAAALSTLVGDRPSELAITSLTRARFCELLAPAAGMSGAAADLFLTGLLSGLDAIVGRPLGDILQELGVNREMSLALLGDPGPGSRLASVYAITRAYEAADWDGLTQIAARASMPLDEIPATYVEAVGWSDQVSRS